MAENSPLTKLKDAIVSTYALARGLRVFFRERVTLAEAEEELKKAIDRRSENFLEVARKRIYDDASSPYLRLLKLAGCEFSDLRSQVLAEGLEATLERLARAGVYLTSDEFKGAAEIVRGGLSFRIAPKSFEGARPAAGLPIESTGSTRRRPARVVLALERQTVYSFPSAVFFSAHGLGDSAHAIYDAILPGGGGVNNLLIQAKLGMNTDRWFARAVPHESWAGSAYYHLITYLVVAAGKLYGPGFPRPEFIDGSDMQRIVDWIAAEQARGKNCCVKTTTSNASRIARTALAAGVSLRGTKFVVSGEPFTDAKLAVIVEAGASATSRYSFTEGGIVGLGCANPAAHDEIHVFGHFLTVIERPDALLGGAIRPLLFTSLHPLATRLLLNVENGDYGVLQKRNCGCALERAGLSLHLSGIRSFEKFTGEGMNYFFGDLYDFVEKTLPAEFGGGPGDYQLAEEEDDGGQTRLTLRVDPRVENLDDVRMLTRLRDGLASGSWGNEFQARVWDGAGTLRIKREPPVASARGKILPLHTRKPS